MFLVIPKRAYTSVVTFEGNESRLDSILYPARPCLRGTQRIARCREGRGEGLRLSSCTKTDSSGTSMDATNFISIVFTKATVILTPGTTNYIINRQHTGKFTSGAKFSSPIWLRVAETGRELRLRYKPRVKLREIGVFSKPILFQVLFSKIAPCLPPSLFVVFHSNHTAPRVPKENFQTGVFPNLNRDLPIHVGIEILMWKS